MRSSALSVSSCGASLARWMVFLLVSTALTQQFYHGFNLPSLSEDTSEADLLEKHLRNSALIRTNDADSTTTASISTNQSFGACLMIKEDNDLLYEWIAYHYMVLPLRFLVIGSDEGNTQDPRQVLHRWDNGTDLRYSVWNATRFVDRFNAERQSNGHENDTKLYAHHQFIQRQKGFLATCVDFLKRRGVQWTALIDSDEFVVMNRLGADDERLIVNGKGPESISHASYQARRDLPCIESNATVLDILRNLQRTGLVRSNCYTMPRLIVGALENVTCSNAQTVNELVRREYRWEEMSTLRFVQHSIKGDFAANKFGKVLLDVSNLSQATISREPRNIHRPYKPECGHGVVHFPDAFLYLNHYIGSWERYRRAGDDRRNRVEWEQRAYFDHGAACDKAVHTWFPRFLETMGDRRAKFLLGVSDGL